MTTHGADARTSARLTVVGCGTMGEAILGGLLEAGAVPREHVRVTAGRDERARALAERWHVAAGTDNLAAVRDATVVIVALKPQRLREVLDDGGLREALRGKLVVSIAAGVRLEQLAQWVPEARWVRAMPNTPCLIREGMTVVARGAGVTDDELALVRGLFGVVGECVELADKHMDAITSLNGSGPAFCYVMLEAMADGGVMMGLPRDVALRVAARVFQGSARMVLETGFHPAALKDQVTTPAGSTIAGLLTMEDGRIRSVLARTIQEATKVAAGLGGSSGSNP
jgi:pyrroline-5-carboxylate reductase